MITLKEFLEDKRHIAIHCKNKYQVKKVANAIQEIRGKAEDWAGWFARVASYNFKIVIYNNSLSNGGWFNWDSTIVYNADEIYEFNDVCFPPKADFHYLDEKGGELYFKTEEDEIKALEKRIEELKEDIKNRKPTLINDEKVILSHIDKRWKYIRKNKYDHSLELSDIEPLPGNIHNARAFDEFDSLFKFVTEDKYYRIDDLVER